MSSDNRGHIGRRKNEPRRRSRSKSHNKVIPENEREAKAEGVFAGLECCVVVEDRMLEDDNGNTVGVVVEGDAKRLVGRDVDEDGDVIDKYGNVKGHAEPYEEPEEAVVDTSVLDGKTVDKARNVVGERGNIFGRIVKGKPAELAGRKLMVMAMSGALMAKSLARWNFIEWIPVFGLTPRSWWLRTLI